MIELESQMDLLDVGPKPRKVVYYKNIFLQKYQNGVWIQSSLFFFLSFVSNF